MRTATVFTTGIEMFGFSKRKRAARKLVKQAKDDKRYKLHLQAARKANRKRAKRMGLPF